MHSWRNQRTHGATNYRLEGHLEAGQPVRLGERPHPEWPVMRATRVIQNRRREMAPANELARLPELADSWKTQLLTPAG